MPQCVLMSRIISTHLAVRIDNVAELLRCVGIVLLV